MKGKTLTLLIVVLLVIAIVLGYVIVFQWFPKEGGEGEMVSQTPITQPTTQSSLSRTGVTLEEQEIFDSFPGPRATAEERLAFDKKVNSIAVDTDTALLDISNCDPQPFALRVKRGGTFKVRNLDSTPHIVGTDPEHQSVVAEGSEITLEVSKALGDDLGNYGYACDNMGAVGITIVSEG